MQFENFTKLMKLNWPEAYKELWMMYPKMDKISNYIGQHIEHLMNEQGLLASDFHLLTALRRTSAHPPYQLMPSELCNFMLFSWGGLAKIMKRLEDKDIIVRVNSEQDKRIRMIRLTNKGVKVIEQTAVKLHHYQSQLLTGFSEKETDQLETLLTKLMNSVDQHSALVKSENEK